MQDRQGFIPKNENIKVYYGTDMHITFEQLFDEDNNEIDWTIYEMKGVCSLVGNDSVVIFDLADTDFLKDNEWLHYNCKE